MTKSLLFSAVAVVAFLSILLAISGTTSIMPEPTPSHSPETQKQVTISITDQIVSAAVRHGIDQERFLATAKCERGLRPGAVGDDGWSIGIFQIHLPSHPDVTKELALDPELAIEWSAKKFKIDPTIWVCYNKLYGNE